MGISTKPEAKSRRDPIKKTTEVRSLKYNQIMKRSTILLILAIIFLAGCQLWGATPSPPIPASQSPSPSITPSQSSPVSSSPSVSTSTSPQVTKTPLPPISLIPPNAGLAEGRISAFLDEYGFYFLYRPTKPSNPPQTLVVIHGTPAKDLTAGETALYYAEHWAPFAEENGWLLLVPAFNQADFSSRRGEITDALTGYRGLFGREIGADEWILRLLGLGWEALDQPEAPILIYGHSAGGQYVGRFLVTHPERVERAVISAAVTYPQPDPALSWPYGMGPLSSEIVWDDGTTAQVAVQPDLVKWLAASQIPTKVIVGLNDLEPQLQRPGQEGRVRLAIGKNWVESMRLFASENGLESQISFEAIPGKGHSMLGLLPYCQRALLE